MGTTPAIPPRIVSVQGATQRRIIVRDERQTLRVTLARLLPVDYWLGMIVTDRPFDPEPYVAIGATVIFHRRWSEGHWTWQVASDAGTPLKAALQEHPRVRDLKTWNIDRASDPRLEVLARRRRDVLASQESRRH